MLGNQKIIACSHFSVFSTNRQINDCNQNYYQKPLPQSSRFNKKHHYPVRITTYLGILSEMKRGKRQCKFSFNKAVILKQILNIFKSDLKKFALLFKFKCNYSPLQFIHFQLEFLEFWFRFQVL